MMKLTDYIEVIDVLSKEQCEYIINLYKDSPMWLPATVGHEMEINTNRKCSSINPFHVDVLAQHSDPEIFDIINFAHKTLLEEYHQRHNSFRCDDFDVGILRYEPGEYYIEHVDYFMQQPRSLSSSICLNYDYEGGELSFFNGEYDYRIEPGQAVVFPSNFMYPHQVKPVKFGVRYNIVSWYF